VTDARDELVARVSRNLALVHGRIAATGRDPATVRVLAMLKAQGVGAAGAAGAAGLVDVGENYADELVAHHRVAPPGLTWHFWGALQRNKLARLAPLVAVYGSVASGAQAAAVAARAPGARCYVQVDVAGLPGRAGCAPGAAGEVAAAAAAAGLSVEGLSCVASPDPALAAGEFAGLRRLADDLGLEGCSMGMSGDLEAACRAGATMLRLGTALFGPRPQPPSRGVA
jgi:PLP dependent protein